MLLLGLQKLTLLDFPSKMACTVFTGGCDFRCPFCHNASLVERPKECPVLPVETFFEFLNKRRRILQGVCITGGEPTLQPDLEEFIRSIRELGYAVKLDTNGNHPAVLKNLVKKGLLDYVAMDIKNCPEHYGKTVGAEHFDCSKIRESVDFLLSGEVDYEFRTTVVRELHSPDDFRKIGEWIRGAGHYFLQGFEDSGDLIGEGYSGYDKKDMENLLNITREYIPTAEIRGL